MIATEAKISGIDETRKEYYDYLSAIYGEIASYLKIQDGTVNSQKLEMMFGKTTSSFVYWNESRQEMSEEAKMNMLKGSVRKYRLKEQGEKYLMTEDQDDKAFGRLSENMKLAGYRFDPKDRAFVRDVK